MAVESYYPPRPWRADKGDIDEEEFRVIRAADGRPVAFVSKWLSANKQEDVARLIVGAPVLLEASRVAFFLGLNSDQEWAKWRRLVGPTLAEIWPVEMDR